LLLAAGLTALAAAAQDTSAPPPPHQAQFVAAYSAARAGVRQTGPDSDALRAYILYPYLEAARLGAALDDAAAEWTADDAAAADFLARHDAEPVAVNLRRILLDSLAARALWPQFLDQYRAAEADTLLRCRYLLARIRTGATAALGAEIRAEWLTPNRLPLECEPVFQWLRDEGSLDGELTAARVRLLLENGEAEFARIIARRLPAAGAAPLLTWADLIERPGTALRTYVETPGMDVDPEALLDGWSRLARDDPDSALQLNEALTATIAPEQVSRFTLALALGLAWDRRPETVATFARVNDADLDDYALGWLARAALWADLPALARDAIERMSPEQRDSSTWRYWAARVSAEHADRDALYESLLPRDNYYSAAAAGQSHDRASLHPESHVADLLTIARLSSLPALERARELRLVRLPVAAAREWQFAARAFTPHEREQSVHLAMSFDWFDLAVATATELGLFFDYELLYPQPHRDLVEAAAREFDVEAALIFAVMRQESLYRSDAESAAGAVGLMQLTAGTARDVTAALGLDTGVAGDLLDPAINIRLGAARLAALIERYDDHLVPALAAYNAGPAAADRWLPAAPMDSDIWLENVPFNETREYVRRVLWHSVVFEWLDGDRARPREWLDPVQPAD